MDRKIVPFEGKHVKYIIGSEHKRDQEDWVQPPIIDQWLKAWEGKLWAFTAMIDGIPIACGGISLQEWNKAEVWAVFSSSFKQHKLFIYRFIKTAIVEGIKKFNIIRLQATIDPQYPENIKWIESLRFEYEGILRKYGPQNQDYWMYSRLSDDSRLQ